MPRSGRAPNRAPKRASGTLLASAAMAAVAGLGGVARAAPVAWNSTIGLWSETFRWDTNSVPGASDDVTIASTSAQVTIKQNPYFANTLVSDGALIIESGSLSLVNSGTFNGSFTLTGNGSTLSGTGNATLNSTATWSGYTTMNGSGKTIVSATGTLNIQADNQTKFLDRNLDNFGVVNFSGPSGTGLAMGAVTITNKAGGVFNTNIQSFGNYFGNFACTFLNEGTFNNQGTGIVTFGGQNSAPVMLVNSGQFNVSAGTIVLQTSATHTGDFAISAGATLQFDASQTFSAGSDLTGAGTLYIHNAGTNTFGGTVNITTATFDQGTNIFNGAFTSNTFQAQSGGTYTFNGSSTLGQTLISNASFAGSGDMTLSGSSSWTGSGTLSGIGKTILLAGANLNLIPQSAVKVFQRLFQNRGTVSWLGTNSLANLNFAGGTFENQAGGTFNVSGSNYSLVGVSGVNAFNNAGSFVKTASGSVIIGGSGTSAVAFANSGTVTLSDGLLQFDGSFSNSGNLLIQPGFGGGGTLTANAGFNNTGQINISAGTLNLAGTLTTAQLGAWSNTGGKVNLLGTLNNTGATLALNNTTGALRLGAASLISGGSIATSGTSRVEVIGVSTLDAVTMSGPVNLFQQANLIIANGMTLAGTLSLDATSSALLTFNSSQSIAGTGQITTAGSSTTATVAATSGATLTIGAGVLVHPGTRDLNIGSATSAVLNNGTMSADVSGRTLTLAGTSVQNGGMFQANNGGVLSVTGTLANLAGSTLTGGSWYVGAGSTLRLASGNIATNAALLVLDGASSNVYTGAGTTDALAQLAQNAAAGDLSILNGRNLTSTANFANFGKLTIGSGSTWNTSTLFTNSGTATVSGTLSTGKTVDESLIVLSGGTHTTSGDFIVGSATTSARYDLNSGLLSVAGFATLGSGPSGAGVFNQTGGTFAAAKQIYISTAGTNTSTFNLSNGAINSGELFVGFLNGAHGIMNQTGGTITLTGDSNSGTIGALTLGYSSINTTTGVYNLSAGTLNDQSAMIGYAGPSTFTQTGGTHNVSGTSGLSLANFGGGTATYSLSNGATLNVTAGEKIGYFGSATFNQSGGVHTVGATVSIGDQPGAAGIVNLSGGTYSAAVINLLRGQFNYTGGALNYQTFLHWGGAWNGTLSNSKSYQYLGGSFNGRMINSGTVTLLADFAPTDGLDNRANFTVPAGRIVTLAGMGLNNSGNLTVSGTLNVASTVNSGVYTQGSGSASLGNVSGTGSIAISAGNLTATTLRQNSLSFTGSAGVTLAQGGGVSIVNNITLPAGGETAFLDLKNNTLLVDYSGASPLTALQASVASGYNAGAWTGAGIRSATAAADPAVGIAVAEAGDVLHLSGTQTATFQGQTVDATSVIVRLTKLGDTNLDGTVSFGDFQRLEQNFGLTTTLGWRVGDFNYDGVVDYTDFTGLYDNYGQTIGMPAAPVPAETLASLEMFAGSVPEPSGVGLFALAGAIGMLRRTRRVR